MISGNAVVVDHVHVGGGDVKKDADHTDPSRCNCACQHGVLDEASDLNGDIHHSELIDIAETVSLRAGSGGVMLLVGE